MKSLSNLESIIFSKWFLPLKLSSNDFLEIKRATLFFYIRYSKKCKNFEGCSLYTANVAQHIEHAKVNFRWKCIAAYHPFKESYDMYNIYILTCQGSGIISYCSCVDLMWCNIYHPNIKLFMMSWWYWKCQRKYPMIKKDMNNVYIYNITTLLPLKWTLSECSFQRA